MAANKFATMLHRNTNKMVVILVYAVLEWLLIVLLLLNSFFSYLITRFAIFFGLQHPCLLCSRVDHVLQPGKKKSSTDLDKDLVCEAHAAEISKLGYCSNHQRLAETQNMCEDCLASRPNHHEHSLGIRHRIGFISWVSQEKNDEDVVENTNKCSCCNESLRSQLYPPYLLLKPSWGDDGNYTSKGSLIVESIEDGEKEGSDSKGIGFERNNGEEEDHDDEHQILSDIESFILREVAEDRLSSVSNLQSDEKDVAEKDEKEDDLNITEMDPSSSGSFIHRFADDSAMKASFLEDRSIEVINVHFENDDAACDDHRRLIPIKFIDSITSMHCESCKIDEDPVEMEQEIEPSAVEAHSSTLKMDDGEEETSIRELESFDASMPSLENSIVLEIEEFKMDSAAKVRPERVTTEEAETMLNDERSVKAASEEQHNNQVDLPLSQEPPLCSHESSKEDESSTDDGSSTEDESSTSEDDTEVQNAFEAFLAQNNLSKPQSLSNVDNNTEADMEEPASSCQCIAEDQSSESEDDAAVANAFDDIIAQNNLCCKEKTGADDNDYAEAIEKTASADEKHEERGHRSSKCSEPHEAEEEKLPETPTSADGLHYRKLTLFDKREPGAEDSVDGSVASEAENGGDPSPTTIERLKTALKSERKALSAVYQELEEERSASAVAANQTMAMITRLQEEKAAMQMEALQYQRMMEEQAEYDQEALQLLNELMLKREREKQELERELEEYRHKVMDYEARERLSVLKRIKDGDDPPIDLDRRGDGNADAVTDLEDMALECVDHVSALDDSLAEFEEERASILDQLRALEEKILSLEENEELVHENWNHGGTPEDSVNARSDNDFSDENAKHFPGRTMGSLAKTLLPYLDAAENEAEEARAFDDSPATEPEPVLAGAAKASIEEEVDRVYERLQALETDREFLQHCVGSIQNGDKGVDLLQEILQHLRDLKAVEVRLKSLGSDPLE